MSPNRVIQEHDWVSCKQLILNLVSQGLSIDDCILRLREHSLYTTVPELQYRLQSWGWARPSHPHHQQARFFVRTLDRNGHPVTVNVDEKTARVLMANARSQATVETASSNGRTKQYHCSGETRRPTTATSAAVYRRA